MGHGVARTISGRSTTGGDVSVSTLARVIACAGAVDADIAGVLLWCY